MRRSVLWISLAFGFILLVLIVVTVLVPPRIDTWPYFAVALWAVLSGWYRSLRAVQRRRRMTPQQEAEALERIKQRLAQIADQPISLAGGSESRPEEIQEEKGKSDR